MEDFIVNNYTIVFGAIVLLGFIAKFLVGYFAKDKSVIVPANEAIDEMTEYAKAEVTKIKEKHIKRPDIDIDGFQIIKQPSNPNNNKATEDRIEEKEDDESG